MLLQRTKCKSPSSPRRFAAPISIIEAGVPCAACERCLAGRYNVCPKIKFRSSAASIPHFQGTLQDRINHPTQWCHKLPENLSYDEGALLEPLSVAIHSVRKANIRPKSRCLITGAGAIGLLCSAVAKSYGCEQVVMTDIASNRLEFARNNGFAEEVHTIVPSRGADVQEDLSIAQDLAEDLLALGGEPVLSRGGFDAVFECTGAESCVRVGVYAARPSSSVLLVGMGPPIQTLPMSMAAIKEVDIKGVWRYVDTYPEALQILLKGKEDLKSPNISKLITHSFEGLESVPDAFARAIKVPTTKVTWWSR
ncbi:NAD(P)-binding protein [Lipomyces doorenjongii]